MAPESTHRKYNDCHSLRWHYPGQVQRVSSQPKIWHPLLFMVFSYSKPPPKSSRFFRPERTRPNPACLVTFTPSYAGKIREKLNRADYCCHLRNVRILDGIYVTITDRRLEDPEHA